jgi:hypothetical protein
MPWRISERQNICYPIERPQLSAANLAPTTSMALPTEPAYMVCWTREDGFRNMIQLLELHHGLAVHVQSAARRIVNRL